MKLGRRYHLQEKRTMWEMEAPRGTGTKMDSAGHVGSLVFGLLLRAAGMVFLMEAVHQLSVKSASYT